MKIDHIGYAVSSIEKAKQTLEKLGYVFGPTIRDENRNVSLAFGKAGGASVELVAPMSAGSPVDMYLSKIGPAPYHICYACDDLETEIARLKKQHFKVTVPPAPAVAFGGKRVAFLYSLSIGLIEIVEYGKPESKETDL